jgi:arylsulfatase A-like enzyme
MIFTTASCYIKRVLICLLMAGLSYAVSAQELESQEAESRPNIIIILGDDAGYSDFGVYGSNNQIKTPNIDRIARQGVTFKQGYVPASVCSPSRAGLLTGRYQQRFGYEENLPRKPQPGDVEEFMGLPIAEITLARQLKKLGYHTGVIGKWHLGYEEKFHPLNRGFDEFFGFLGGSRSYFPSPDSRDPIYRNRKKVEGHPYLTDAFGNEAASFVKRNNDRPFFLYVSFNAVHTPMHAEKEDMQNVDDISHPKRQKLAAMTRSMDQEVGQILDELNQQNIKKNTMIFFLNDNGGPVPYNASSNAPLRGTKGTALEGGIRVPFLMQWPQKVPAGMTINQPVSSLDIFPTSVAAAGGTLPGDRAYDGANLVPYVTGDTAGRIHEELFWRRKSFAAVRSGPWKLIRFPDRPAELYNIKKDIGEEHNLASRHPDLVQTLYQKLDNWERKLQNPLWQVSSRWNEHTRKLYDQQYVIEHSWLSEEE